MPTKTEISNSYVANTPNTRAEIEAHRAKARKNSFNVGKAVVGSAIAMAAGVVTYNKLTEGRGHTIAHFVQPGETINDIVQQMEHKYGEHPDNYDYQDEEFRLRTQYPMITPGEKIEVTVK